MAWAEPCIPRTTGLSLKGEQFFIFIFFYAEKSIYAKYYYIFDRNELYRGCVFLNLSVSQKTKFSKVQNALNLKGAQALFQIRLLYTMLSYLDP